MANLLHGHDDVRDDAPPSRHASVRPLPNITATLSQPKCAYHHAVCGMNPRSSVCTRRSTFGVVIRMEARALHHHNSVASRAQQSTTSTVLSNMYYVSACQ
ncbi:unnamed protein product [Rotaria magnacalcarata]|uniref:Uncharacterized protein n=1 Tax=Rotaria magnacalcarata TaxID=392030 RepID=A0A816CP97_9BILA|nr:unnamed protein product [Rotaria magnacalcarata]CAF1624431.1 unnamed protein product [Rotaria magnacalcarata]CAF2043265.1 unnamed protein product [Rotaria magnacalcarata]CAF2141849.1 unnamed protein product [Rotaria magnacalcarata]CAF3950735.1 unnamed protein product [Rotaria magnacalcarata]